MSGHSDFTWWIEKKAKYVLNKKGKKCKIKGTFFSSSPVPNSDEFNIRTDRGTLDWGDIDYDELRMRYQKDRKEKN